MANTNTYIYLYAVKGPGSQPCYSFGRLRQNLHLHQLVLTFKYVDRPTPRTIRTHGHAHLSPQAGAPLDASIGEARHQRHKRANKYGSGRDPAAHHARRENTALAIGRMARGQSWVAGGFDYVGRTGFTPRPQTAGVGCIRVLNCMTDCLRGDIVSPTDPDEGAGPSRAMAVGTYAGAAMWDAEILRIRDANAVAHSEAMPAREEWIRGVAQSGVVPHEKKIKDALRVWFGCGRRAAEPACDDTRCPDCWLEGEEMTGYISCSRFKHGARGLGRWKGGDVRSASLEGVTPRAWALGDGMGEDVEIYTHRQAKDKGLSRYGNVTLGKILYFFRPKLRSG